MLQSAVDALSGRSGGGSGAARRRGVTMTVHIGTALLGLVVLHAMGRAVTRWRWVEASIGASGARIATARRLTA